MGKSIIIELDREEGEASFSRGADDVVRKFSFGGMTARRNMDSNPFYHCRGFTFNACTFDDCEGK